MILFLFTPDSGFVPHTNEPKYCLKSEKQSPDAVKRTLDFETDEATGNKSTTFAEPIIIDSDDDNETLLHANTVKNKRHYHNLDGSSNDTLDSLHKMKKFKQEVKQEPSTPALSTTKSDHFFSASQRQSLTIKKCDGKQGTEEREPTCSFPKAVDSNCSNETPKAGKTCSLRVKEFLNASRERVKKKMLECGADMLCALEEDDDFCAKAVCALYRLSGMNGLIFSGSKGFEECDLER